MLRAFLTIFFFSAILSPVQAKEKTPTPQWPSSAKHIVLKDHGPVSEIAFHLSLKENY